VHDVGKLAISGAVLLQAGPLTEEEYAGLKAHAAIGAEIVSEVFAEDQVAWVRHHERWNGHGYPDGLGAGELSDGAAILAIADAWDAMTSARPYRIAGSPAEALAECRRERGAQFRPVGGRCARRPGPTGRARAGSGRGTARRPGLIAAGGCARRGRGG
jgi:HD-GYP domain-containing protein (c-di-GMP phosphodiesterase class II)